MMKCVLSTNRFFQKKKKKITEPHPKNKTKSWDYTRRISTTFYYNKAIT